MIFAYLLLFLMIFLWSFNFIVVDIAVDYIPVLSISLYRFVFASIAFILIDSFLKLRQVNKNIPKKNNKISNYYWILIIAASFVGQSLYFLTLYGSVNLIGPSLPALFVCLLSPVIIAILAIFFFDEKLNKVKIIGFIIATIGGFLLVTGGDLSNLTPKSRNYLGYLLALITPVQWGIYSIITKKLCKHNSMFDILKYICYLATIELFFYVLLNGEMQIFVENLFNLPVLLCGLYIGIVCHVIAYFIWQHSQQVLDSSKVASFLYIEPFITLIFSMILQRQETIVLWNIIGGLVVLCAVLLINKDTKTTSECLVSES